MFPRDARFLKQTRLFFTSWKFFESKKNTKKSPNNLSNKPPDTPPKFDIALEKSWLEDEFPFGIAYFRGYGV